MELGAFSVSLAVKDLSRSRAFYEKLGFSEQGGNADQGWLILRNGSTIIGLFQGMFEGNILTFNPGFGQNGSQPDRFMDIRKIQETLLERGLELQLQTDPDGTGIGHVTLTDPDGNAILIDQHRPAPGS